MLLYYIRHGDPIYSPDSLTPLGERQAEAVGKRLAARGIDRVFVSSSERAKLTAKPLCEMLHLEPVELDWANEGHAWRDLTVKKEDGSPKTWCFADPETMKLFCSDEVRMLDKQWYKHPAFAKTRYEEGIKRIEREADAFLASLGYTHVHEGGSYYTPTAPNEERVALFAHQGFGLAFLASILDVPYPLFTTRFDLTHSSMTVVEFRDTGTGIVIPKALEVSNDSHLYKEGLPTKYNNRIFI